MKSDTEMSTNKRDASPPGSPRTSRFPHNLSSVSNNISALNDEEALIRDRSAHKSIVVTSENAPKPRLSKEEKPRKYSVDKLPLPDFTVSMKKRLATVLKSRVVESFMLGLIVIYTLQVFVTIVLDDGSNNAIANTDLSGCATSCQCAATCVVLNSNQTISDALDALKYVELAIICIFILEILLKSYAYGIRTYFKDGWYIVDAVIVLIAFVLVILDILPDVKSFSSLNRVRGIFRLFRIFLLLRKANEVSRITRKNIRTTGVAFKTPVEKVLDLFETMKTLCKDKTMVKDINWAIEIVSSNKLYEIKFEPTGDGKGDQNNGNLWLKSYNYNNNIAEDLSASLKSEPLKRRMSFMPAIVTVGSPQKVNNYVIRQEALDMLASHSDGLEFDIIKFHTINDGDDLSALTIYLFEKHNLFEKLNIDQDIFRRFTKKVQMGYLPNPYHSATHAADVLQTVNYMLTTGELMHKAAFNNLEVASLLLGAAIHDYDHPGTNNAFQINTGASFAIKYNDRAVLENHHVSSIFAMLQNENYNIFASFSKEDFKAIRERMIAIVLATDMSTHFTDIAKLKARIAADFDLKDKDKKFIMEITVHAADISNPAKPWDTCKEWTMRVVTEFFNQGDAERQLGLPVSHLCDRYTTNLSKSQIGFIDFVVSPLFGLIHEILPKFDISNLEINKAKWKEQIEHYDEELKRANEEKDKSQLKEISA